MFSTKNSCILLLVAALVAFASACGGGASPTGTTEGPQGPPGPQGPEDPDEIDTEDGPGFEAPEQEAAAPAELVVPVHVTIEMLPGRAIYAPGDLAFPEVIAFDDEGVAIEGIETEISVDPPDAVVIMESGHLEMVQQGVVTVTGCTVPPVARIEQVCGQRRFSIDRSPPEILIAEPLPGSEIVADETGQIEIVGRVVDENGELRAYVNGVQIAVDDQGRFTTTIPAEFGVNHIEIAATDHVHGGQVEYGMDVMYAPEYLPLNDASPVTSVRLEDAIQLQLGQAFFDDFETPVPDEFGVTETSDLSDLVRLILQNLDWNQYLGNLSAAGTSINITNVDVGEPLTEVLLTDTGVEIFAQMPAIEVSTTGSLDVGGTPLSLEGGFTIAVAAVTDIGLLKTGPDMPYESRVRNVLVAVEGAEGNFDSPEANAIFSLLESPLRQIVEEEMQTAVESGFLDELPRAVVGVLEGIEESFNDEGFVVDTGLGDPVDVRFFALVSRLQSSYWSDMDAKIRTDIGTPEPPHFPASLGVPLSIPEDQPAPFWDASRIQLGLKMSFLNGLLYAIWQSGVLDVDLAMALPDELNVFVEGATMTGKLPPVMAPAPPEVLGYDLVVSIGQIELDVDFTTQSDTYGVRLDVPARFVNDNGVIRLELADEPMITAWPISTDANFPLFTGDSLTDLLLSQVWPQLSGLSDNFAFPVPMVDLSQLGSVAPALSEMQYELTLEEIEVRDGYLTIEGDLVGSL